MLNAVSAAAAYGVAALVCQHCFDFRCLSKTSSVLVRA
jgi:hypothetical protein